MGFDIGQRVKVNLGRGQIGPWGEGIVVPAPSPQVAVKMDRGGTVYAPEHKVRAVETDDTDPTKYNILMAFREEWQDRDLQTNLKLCAKMLQDTTDIPDGSVQPQYGFGNWGVEQGIKIETTTTEGEAVRAGVRMMLTLMDQECAYVEVDGDAYEWTRTGEENPIVGNYKEE